MFGVLSGRFIKDKRIPVFHHNSISRALKTAANSLSMERVASVGPGTTVHHSALTHVKVVCPVIRHARNKLITVLVLFSHGL